MSDDLIEALRLQGWNDAADCIEELERERDEAMMTGHDLAKIEYRDLVSDLETKLAKAVETLRFYAAVYKSPFGTRARIVLAELEKEND